MKLKNSLFFKKLLYNKNFTIPFSVLLSFAIWIVITIVQKPTMDRSFSDMTVAINLENTFASENNMSLIGDISDQRFTVLVMGSNRVVSALSANDINLYASAATVDSPGEYDLLVSATPGSEYDVLDISPKTVKVRFDYVETQEYTIEALAEGVTAAEGLIAENPAVSGLESGTISITGPRTTINEIASVKAKTAVNRTLSASETFDAEIVLYNEKGDEIEQTDLTFSINEVKVTVPISKRKTVSVNVDFSNMPEGFDKSTIPVQIDHETVEIIGTPETVDKIKSITLSPIDLTTVSKESNTFKVTAKLPEGVRLFEKIENFEVKIDLSNYVERTITVTRVRYTGLTEGLKTSGTTSINGVKICGPRSVINKLNIDNVYAVRDLSNKIKGEHTVNTYIGFDNYNDVWAIGTYQTSITIK